MRTRRSLIRPPLEWQAASAPVPLPAIPVLTNYRDVDIHGGHGEYRSELSCFVWHPRCYRFPYSDKVILCGWLATCGDEKNLFHLSIVWASVLSSISRRVRGEAQAGCVDSACCDGTATGCGTRTGPKSDAARVGGGNRALRGEQKGECQHGHLSLRARDYPDRFQDRTHGDRLQEDAGREMSLPSALPR